VGFGYGVYLFLKNGPTYYSEMTVRANFNSSRALYGTAELMNSLIAGGRHDELAKLLSVNPKEASSLQHFEVRPVKSDLIITQMYKDQFLNARKYNSTVRMDTFWTRTVKYSDFKESLTDYDYPVQVVTLSSTSPVIFPKIQNGILSYVSNIELLQHVRNNEIESNKQEIELLLASIRGLDSLSKSYNKRLASGNATPPGNVMTLMSGSTPYENPELELYDKLFQLKDELKNARNQAAIETNILEVYSPFNPYGRRESFYKQNMAIHGFLGFVLTVILLIVIKIYRVLRNMEEKENAKRRLMA
jgi:hypothetical protein